MDLSSLMNPVDSNGSSSKSSKNSSNNQSREASKHRGSNAATSKAKDLVHGQSNDHQRTVNNESTPSQAAPAQAPSTQTPSTPATPIQPPPPQLPPQRTPNQASETPKPLNAGLPNSRKRSAEPPHNEPEPKRVRVEVNGYELHPPEQQRTGRHGLYAVPPSKKIREMPRFAQKFHNGAKANIPPFMPSHPSEFPDYKGPQSDKVRALSSSHGVNGHPPGSSGRDSTRSPATGGPGAPPTPSGGPQWEANILDHISLDQVSKTVADWLFTTVVVAPNLGSGAVWEVEAKLGHLIDTGTNERLHLPALSDFVVDRSRAPRLAFRSTMTEAQHRAFNEFLNGAVAQSSPPRDPAARPPSSKQRVKIDYRHTYQTDTFYELPMNEAKQHLPPSVLAMTDRARSPRVRVSVNQKTGEEIARIVKVRVSDLDIHAPMSLFDVRISVNVEVAYPGSVNDLVRLVDGKRRNPPRNKDRMTYNHLAYQIDLTQVTTLDNAQVTDKEHELEVEICAMDAFREEGRRLQRGEPSDYVQMVNGFVDNVRLLQRQLPLH